MLFFVWYYILVSMALGAMRIPYLGFHEGSLEDIRDADTQIPSSPGSQGWWTEDFSEMTLEDKTKRLNTIQIYTTLNKKIECDPAPTKWTEFIQALSEVFFLLPDLDDLVLLSHAAPKRHIGVKRLVQAMPSLIKLHDEGVKVWMKGSPLDQLVVIALEALQEDYLSVLRCLQSYLPRGELKPIRLNPDTGLVCRGALELFLTEGVDLRLNPVTKLENDNVREALERVKLIMNIWNHFEGFEKVRPTLNFIEIYDALLQTKSASGKEDLVLIALRCMHHMAIQNAQEKETECIFHIISHISKFNAACRDRIQDHLTQNDRFGKIYRTMFNSFEYQAALRPSIQRYFAREDMDRYIGNLLLPFVGISLVRLEYIEHIITSFKAQETALKDGTAELYGLDPCKAQKYREEQEFVIQILYKASPYIEGSKVLLDSAIPKLQDNVKYRLHSIPISTSENSDAVLCPICLDGFLQGQRVIKLKCSKPHKFHEQCMNAHIISSEDRCTDVLCPSCRRYIYLPIPINQHTFE
ncbi:hypothetical protein DFH28DRAFT_966638 [Melampsora americana]|nr:hypothetical protein DFH28DRAFT_966638 [Melampsora americana]